MSALREQTRVRSSWAGLAAALAIMAAIVVMSHQQKPPSMGSDPELSATAGHLVAYGLLAMALLYGGTSVGLPFREAAFAAISLSLAFGVTDEIHQRFVPGRHADPWDLLADLIGAAIAVAIVALWRKRANPPS